MICGGSGVAMPSPSGNASPTNKPSVSGSTLSASSSSFGRGSSVMGSRSARAFTCDGSARNVALISASAMRWSPAQFTNKCARQKRYAATVFGTFFRALANERSVAGRSVKKRVRSAKHSSVAGLR